VDLSTEIVEFELVYWWAFIHFFPINFDGQLLDLQDGGYVGGNTFYVACVFVSAIVFVETSSGCKSC